MSASINRLPDERVNWKTSIPFIALHFIPFLAFFTGVSTKAIVLCVVLYFGRMFFITAGYHRYFAHRSYKTSRAFQFILAFGGGTAVQQGALWWASHHRLHHRFSDTDRDIHSPQKGFMWSHVGWFLSDKYGTTDYDSIKDFAKYPELVWLNKHDWVAPWMLGIACFLIAGWSGLVIGFFLSTVLLWHGTFSVNSLNHVFGRRRYATTDTSRNSAILALWTMGEGWHNNHHYFAASVRQGFFWWEIDMTYYILKGLSLIHVVHDLRVPNARVKAAARIRDGQLDIGMFRAHWTRATSALQSATSHMYDMVSPPTPDVDLDPEFTVEAAMASTQSDLRAKREQLEALVRTSCTSLEDRVTETLRSAEEFSKLSRRRQRDLVDG